MAFFKVQQKNQICMEPQKTPNSQSNPEKQEESQKYQIILQSYNNQNSILSAGKQTCRPMEQNLEPRNKHTYTERTNF